MRCNRPKPIFGMFHLLCGVLIVSVVLGINAISSIEAVTQIGAGDRIFFRGDQWATNRTASQTGFEVIRISSDRLVSDMKYIRNTLNLKLMVGLGYDVVPREKPWPGDTMDEKLSIFRDKLANWLGTHSLDISAFHFNLEYEEEFYTDRYPDDPNDLAASKEKRVRALTDTMTLIVKNYQRTIREVCDSLDMVGSYSKLWVFSAKGTGNTTYEEFGCDWNALTSGTYAIDVATMGCRHKQSRWFKIPSLQMETSFGSQILRISKFGEVQTILEISKTSQMGSRLSSNITSLAAYHIEICIIFTGMTFENWRDISKQ